MKKNSPPKTLRVVKEEIPPLVELCIKTKVTAAEATLSNSMISFYVKSSKCRKG